MPCKYSWPLKTWGPSLTGDLGVPTHPPTDSNCLPNFESPSLKLKSLDHTKFNRQILIECLAYHVPELCSRDL